MRKELSKIWLSSPHMGGTEQNFVRQAFETNWIAPLGPNVEGFESDIATFLNTNPPPFVAALSSGTAALHLALILAEVEAGDEVLCQSMTFSASANPICYLQAKPIFIDSETFTWNLDPDLLEEAILHRMSLGKKPKALVAVHLYGMPFQAERIVEICKKYQIVLIEDSAEALGSSYKGKRCGTLGDLAVLSFNGNKIITTSGGGALVTYNKEWRDRSVYLSTQARDPAPHYQHSQIGYNYRMSNVCAGIGRGQMEVLNSHIERRRAMHQFYKKVFAAIDEVEVYENTHPDYFSNYWLSCILLNPSTKFDAKELRLWLEKYQIECRPLWKPMHLQPVFADCPFYGDKVSETLFNNGLCLPSGSNLTDADRERIANAIKTYFKK